MKKWQSSRGSLPLEHRELRNAKVRDFGLPMLMICETPKSETLDSRTYELRNAKVRDFGLPCL